MSVRMVRRALLRTLLAICVLVALAPLHVHAQDLNDFKINDFTADYYLTKNEKDVAQLRVVETIQATFPEFDQNHGIERAIPETYKDKGLKLEVVSVKKTDGGSWDYTTRISGGNTVLRIGDADQYVHGVQTYIVTYKMQNVMGFTDDSKQRYDHDEWYWDTNGDQWSQYFSKVSARIHIPAQLAANITLAPRCFTGSFGSTVSNCTIEKTTTGSETLFSVATSEKLSPYENMSFVLGFQANTFKPYKRDPRVVVATVIGVFLVLGLPPLLAFMLMWSRWKKTGRDPKGRGIIVPQYSVPDDLDPVLADLILNEKVQTKAVSATLIGLCIKGYIKLYEVSQKKIIGSSEAYEVELTKKTDELSAQEHKVASMVFITGKIGERVGLNTLKNKLYGEVKTLTKNANQQVAMLGYFTIDPTVAKKKYKTWGSVMFVLGVLPLVLFPPALIATGGLALTGVVVLAFGSAMPKRTLQGVDMKEYLLGVKEYMQLAEEDRIKFLQSPGTAEKIDVKNKGQLVKLYEKLLPYAMLFGIEKEWAKQFAGLYAEGSPPSWYSGQGVFNAVIFSNAVSGFGSAAVSSFTPPSSSGSSGFSGGGFSGGGGGGGGGGGW